MIHEDDEVQAHTLDPDDWDELRRVGHRMLDDALDSLKNVREQPAWQSVPQEIREKFREKTPVNATPIGEVYERFKSDIFPYPTGNIHPRFWGWVMGNGTPAAMLADLMASAMNSHVSGYDQAAVIVEEQVLRWMAELMDYPPDSSGLLVSGGTMANLTGVAVARNTQSDFDVRTNGVPHPSSGTMLVYGSTETHAWAGRTCDLLGLGSTAFREVPVDANKKILVSELERMIDSDRSEGSRPLCIVGNAGTIATGANDDFHALADLAESTGLWFHVDGAFGAMAKLSPKYRHLVDGIERADSIAVDLHKWGYLQYEVACILVKDAAAHRDAFSFAPSYLQSADRGIAVKPTELAGRGVQLSRSFRALRVWFALHVHGSKKIGSVIEQNINQAQRLASLIRQDQRLELLAPAEMNVVCFRFIDPAMSEDQLNGLNQELLIRIQESGIAVPSNAMIDDRFAIRVANTNHRSRMSDFETLLSTVVEFGAALAKENPREC